MALTDTRKIVAISIATSALTYIVIHLITGLLARKGNNDTAGSDAPDDSPPPNQFPAFYQDNDDNGDDNDSGYEDGPYSVAPGDQFFVAGGDEYHPTAADSAH